MKELFRHTFIVRGRKFAVVFEADLEALERVFDMDNEEEVDRDLAIVNKQQMGVVGYVERVK